MKFSAGRTQAWTPALLVALWAALMFISDPLMPAPGLEGSWVLAAERAARLGFVFGRDFVFTYGPLAFLSTHLFDPETYGWVLLSDLLMALIWASPLLLVNRSLPVVGAYLLAVLFLPIGIDARIVATLLAFVVTAVSRPGWWWAIAAAAFAPLALSKLSFTLAALPLFLLVDTFYALRLRRAPLMTAAFLVTFAICLIATGHPPAVWGMAAGQDWQVISGYSSAMQLAIGLGGLIGLAAIGGVFALLLGWAGWVASGRLATGDNRRQRTAQIGTILLAACWTCFIGFKMGYVRADGHMVITWQFALLAVPPLLACFDAMRPLSRAQLIAGAALMAAVGVGGHVFAIRLAIPRPAPSAFFVDRATELVRHPVRALAWLTPGRWREATEERRRAEAALVHRFPAAVAGSVDAIPIDLAEVIASGLDYRPRPVPQSYSSYTPALQRADAAHLAAPRSAPDTLLLRMGYDVDYHLPTLATGPSLPIIARWYDHVDTDPLGLVLRRRARPRAVARTDVGVRSFALGEWIALPPAAGSRMIMGRFDIDRNLIARGMGLVAREPALFIEVRRPDGREQRFRFIPGMAGVELVLSPQILEPDVEMRNLRGAAGVLLPGSHPAAAPPVTAFRIVGDLTAPYAIHGGRVRLWTLDFPSIGEAKREPGETPSS